MSGVQEYKFDLVISLPAGEHDEDAMMDTLFEAGCDDAIVGTGAAGLVALGFVREGAEPEAIITAAVEQALRGIPGGAVLCKVRL